MNQIINLARFSEAVNDLWTKIKDLVSNTVKITSIKVNGTTQSIGSDKSVNIPVPTAVSQLTNDSAFITKAVADLVNYYTKTYIDSKVSELQNAISVIPKFEIKVLQQLPTTGISKTTLYLIKQSGTQAENLFAEYIRVTDNGVDKWEKLGEQKIDLAPYLTKTEAASTYRNKSDNGFGDGVHIGPLTTGFILENDSIGVKITFDGGGTVHITGPGTGEEKAVAYTDDIPQFTYATSQDISTLINSLS